jgi:hypothetical protein
MKLADSFCARLWFGAHFLALQSGGRGAVQTPFNASNAAAVFRLRRADIAD